MMTFKNTDKTEWENGPWMDEPDKAQWVANGLDCLIVRSEYGVLCGYVGVPEEHRWFGADYNSINQELEVHGGLSFSSRCSPHPDGDHKGICHIEEGAANKTVWWFGFDCSRSGDLCPKHEFSGGGSTYKGFNYVKNHVESLARQLAA